MVICGIFTAGRHPLPRFGNNSFPILPTPHRRCVLQDGSEFRIRLLRLVVCGILIPASDGATLASSLLRVAIASTIAPSVVSCHEPSPAGIDVPRKSALRARMVTTSTRPGVQPHQQ